ncbi:MAG: ABC transporter ATP-binding protein, partial [Clostridiales bacterium]|nr:ABC transporter ATP-binding protein [Clostridiales bacterium]
MAEQDRTTQKPRVNRGPGGPGPSGPRAHVENPMGMIMRLLGYIFKRHGVAYSIVIVCIVISVLANVQGTMFMQTLIDSYIVPMVEAGGTDFSALAAAIARVAMFYAIGILASLLQSQILVNITQGTMQDLRNDLFLHMQDLPIKYFDTHAHGDIMSVYTNDIDTLRQMVSQSIPQLINSVITIISVLICMIRLNIPLTIITLLMVGVMLFFSTRLAALSSKNFVAQQIALGAEDGFIEEMMAGQKVVQVFCHEEENIEKFNKLNEELCRSSNNANRYANVMMPVNAQIGNISYVIIAIVGGTLAINGFGGFTLGALASFLTFNKSFNQPINQVSQQINFIVMGLAGAQRIFALLDEEPEVDNGYVTLTHAQYDESGNLCESEKRTGIWAWKHYHKATDTTTYVKVEGNVEFLGVDFGYNDDKMVLHD